MQKGISLVELLVGVTIFTIFLTTAMGLFVDLFQNHRKVLVKQELNNQASFAMEYMGRALRMAITDEEGDCISEGFTYENPDDDISKIKFINHLQGDACQQFYLEDGKLKHKDTVLISGENKFEISSAKFSIYGSHSGDSYQPKVTILLEATMNEWPDHPPIRLQTTVSKRELDVKN